LAELLREYPAADVFVLFDHMAAADREFLGIRRAATSFLQAIPGVERSYRSLLPLFPFAVRSLDVRAYDVVLTSAHSVANGVRTHRDQLHLSYCHSPMRYAWDLRDEYLRESGIRGVRRAAANMLLDRLQRWDRNASARVDAFVANSHYIADRIRRAYG